MTAHNENLASSIQDPDIGFEERRLAATVAEAAEKLPEDMLKAAINTGLNKGGSHLFVDDQPVSALLDARGNPKKGPRTNLTREQILDPPSRRVLVSRILRSRGIIKPDSPV